MNTKSGNNSHARGPKNIIVERTCANPKCGKRYTPKASHGETCSAKCSVEYYRSRTNLPCECGRPGCFKQGKDRGCAQCDADTKRFYDSEAEHRRKNLERERAESRFWRTMYHYGNDCLAA